MQRIYLPQDLTLETLRVDDEEINYQLQKVLRSQVGSKVIFFDGKNSQDCVFEIIQIEKRHILFTRKEVREKSWSVWNLELYQSLPNKLEKLEWILQKWVEVWYTKFHIFRAQRSQDLKISENKFERLQKIITEAVEQSGRNDIPEIVFHTKLDFSLIEWEKYYFHTDPLISKTLKNVEFSWEKQNIFVWPEWGFDETEIASFEKENFQSITLGKNILRTETASIVVGFYISQQKG